MKNHNKRALLTGATGAIGRAIAEALIDNGIDVVMTCRDTKKGESVRHAIAAKMGQSPKLAHCDLSRKQDIFSLADTWSGPLHILINDAAECPGRRLETEAGIERQFATNVLGYFWMMTAFGPILEKNAPARIVNVASYWAGGLDLDDLEFRRRRYDNDAAYRQSKQADRMLTVAFAKQYEKKNICINACHPGDVRSKLSSDLGFGGYETPEQGAATPVFLATEPIGQQVTGRYFAHLHEETCRFARDREAIERLVSICSTY